MSSLSSKPRVTALIDTYNHERFIAEAIESVLAQDFPGGEMDILVVDDGSTDSTGVRVKRFDDRVRYFCKPNGGQGSALNFGFERARGEIIAMLDGDDVWLPGKVRRVVEAFAQHPEAGMVCHPYQFWDSERDICRDDPGFTPVSGYLPASLPDLLRFGNFGTCGMALRKSVAEQLMPIPPGLKVFADTYVICVAIFLTPVVGLSEHLTRYRHHGGNLASFHAPDAERLRQRWLSFHTAVEELRGWLERMGYDLRRHEIERFLKRQDLVEEMLRFSFEGASRKEFFSYLWEYQKLYGVLWTRRYRLFQSAMALLGFFLGYEGYESLRSRYRGASPLLRLRESVFPAKDAYIAVEPRAFDGRQIAAP